MHTTALLIKTSSIQKYLFASNKLKENIGASHIIEHDLFPVCIPEQTDAKKIFIGGGKALFKFTSKERAKSFLKAFSLNVISYFPGIQINAAIGAYNETNFSFCRRALSKQLTKNESLYPSNTLLPKDGIFMDCPQTNEYQEVDCPDVGVVSKVSQVKFEACKRAQQMRNKNLDHENFVFTDEIELLGQQKDKGYIAIVHIDGNNLGQRFIKVEDENELIKLSENVKRYGTGAMDKLIRDLIHEFTNTELSKEIILVQKDGKNILPIRPILTGGDDITFVCEGRLGIYLAERFIIHFEALANQTLKQGEKRITACAGVAIVKTKFPFFKAYELAEELCHEAKMKSRAKGDSWISFQVASQGVSGNLKEIRKSELECANGLLTANPYSLDLNHHQALNTVKSIANDLNAHWPMNKIMELRDVIKQTESSQTLFKKEIEYRDYELPELNLWQDGKTRYWDAIQLLDFYPKCFLKNMKINN